MTTETPTAAVAAPAAPAAVAPAAAAVAAPVAPVVAAPAAVTQDDSLLPNDPPAAGAAPVVKAEPLVKAESVVHPEWFYANGVKGSGPAPAWYKADKYKTLEDQAKAYPELEKRFGAFTGAPKDGKYEFTVDPALNLKVEMDTEHPVFHAFNKWAADSQLSQEGYNQAINLFAQYEASQLPDFGVIKTQLGENADARIVALNQWGKANLDSNSYQDFRSAMSGHNAASVLKIVEQVVGLTRQPAMQKPGADVSAAKATGLDEINAMQAAKGKDGRRLYETDLKYRAEVEAKRFAFYNSQENV